jgi:hypothetical protein
VLVDTRVDHRHVDIHRPTTITGGGWIQVGAYPVDSREIVLRLDGRDPVRKYILDTRILRQVRRGRCRELTGKPAENIVVDLIDLYAGFRIVCRRDRCRAAETGLGVLEPDKSACLLHSR